MFLMNPVIVVLHNQKLDRYHESIYLENPLPGPPSPDKPVRHKSKMHHTEGFATLEECYADVDGKFIPTLREHCDVAGPIRVVRKQIIEWSGEGIPAMNNFFRMIDDETAEVLL